MDGRRGYYEKREKHERKIKRGRDYRAHTLETTRRGLVLMSGLYTHVFF